jgi:hypothetical protein
LGAADRSGQGAGGEIPSIHGKFPENFPENALQIFEAPGPIAALAWLVRSAEIKDGFGCVAFAPPRYHIEIGEVLHG